MKKLLELLWMIPAVWSFNGYGVLAQTPSVESLKDVESTDWAYEALRNLSDRFLNGANAPASQRDFEAVASVSLMGETPKTALHRYSCITGFPDNTYRGNRSLTRYQFAAGLNSCLNQIERLVAEGSSISDRDLVSLQKLSRDFAAELKSLSGRVEQLEDRVATVENARFSTTTKLTGQVIMAANAGGFEGDRIIAPRGAVVSEDNPEATFIYRAVLFFNASFQGTDQLQVRVVTGSDGTDDNVGGLLEPNFGSNLDYTIQGRNDRISLARAFYQFSPVEDLEVAIGPIINLADYLDNNSLIGSSFRSFSTLAFANNFVLFPRPLGGGAIAQWNPAGGAFYLRAGYTAGDAGTPLPGNDGLLGGGGNDDVRLFPTGGGGAEGGLFDDPRQGAIEVEYAPSDAFAVKIHYVAGELFGSDFQGVGANFEWSILPQIGIFGRYGYSDYPDTTLGDINPNYWLVGLSFSDLLVEGSISGIAIAQPFIEDAAGDATQTNFEVFYNYPISSNITISPILQTVFDAGNQSSNGTIYSGTLRSVFSF